MVCLFDGTNSAFNKKVSRYSVVIATYDDNLGGKDV